MKFASVDLYENDNFTVLGKVSEKGEHR